MKNKTLRERVETELSVGVYAVKDQTLIAA